MGPAARWPTFARAMARFRPFRPLLAAISLLVLASLVLEHVNGRFWLNDFRVYYMAADNLRHGLPVYGQVFGEDTGLYKYAPVVLYFFLPYTLLSFQVAATVHFLLIGVLTTACFMVIGRSLGHFVRPLPGVAGLMLPGLLCIAVLLTRELHLGNINMGLILLAALGVERLLAGQRRSAGAALGTVWLIKPYLLLMIVPLVMRREWRVLRTAALTMVAGLLIPLVVQGPGAGRELNRQWFHSMQYHTQVMYSPDHLGQILSTHTGLPVSLGTDLLFIVLAGLFLTLFTWRNTRADHGGPDAMDRGFELWLAMAMVPNLVITDQQHFMFSLPLILYALTYLFTRKDPQVLAAFVAAMVLYATRSSDLWSSPVENRLAGWGILGLGNLLLLAVCGWIWRRWHGTASGPSAGR